jgi:hypothetical protein
MTKIKDTTKELDEIKDLQRFNRRYSRYSMSWRQLKLVMKSDRLEDVEVLQYFVFLVKKDLAYGKFDKIKARLVASGVQQKRELYPNKSSPTASLHAIFICFAIVAFIGHYQVAKVDVKGVYIQTEITGLPI